MNLTSYIEASTGYNEATIESVLESFFKAIQTSLRKGEEVKLTKFGTFSIKDLPERPARNPRTGEAIIVGASRKPVFKFSKEFGKLIQPDANAVLNTPASELPPSPKSETVTTAEPVSETTAKLPPPIPNELLFPATATNWYIKNSDGNFIEVPESQLKNAGVNANTPIWSDRTGWKLVKDIPELAHLA